MTLNELAIDVNVDHPGRFSQSRFVFGPNLGLRVEASRHRTQTDVESNILRDFDPGAECRQFSVVYIQASTFSRLDACPSGVEARTRARKRQVARVPLDASSRGDRFDDPISFLVVCDTTKTQNTRKRTESAHACMRTYARRPSVYPSRARMCVCICARTTARVRTRKSCVSFSAFSRLRTPATRTHRINEEDQFDGKYRTILFTSAIDSNLCYLRGNRIGLPSRLIMR